MENTAKDAENLDELIDNLEEKAKKKTVKESNEQRKICKEFEHLYHAGSQSKNPASVEFWARIEA
jgi:hypothetical protein